MAEITNNPNKEIIKAKIFKINLQQGFILTENDSIIGAYSHHHKLVVFNDTYNNIHQMRIKLPDRIDTYMQTFNQVDGFHIVGWTTDGYKGFDELKKREKAGN